MFQHHRFRRFLGASGMLVRHIGILTPLIFSLFILAACAPPALPSKDQAAAREPARELVLATTTSTYDSGLLDAILPDFEAKTGIKVDVVAVGTGQALKLGEAKDADVLLVHAKSREEQFVADGYAPYRKDVMYNDFVILGPSDDPAGVKGMEKAADAFKKIAESQSIFVSRGDNSGTHMKEMSIWETAGVEPSGDWYQSAGQGMGAVLTMAGEQQAYTLSDRSTYLSRKDNLDLDILVEGDPILFNQYGVLPIAQDEAHQDKFAAAEAFVNWITGPDTQKLIAEFGKDKYGQQLFYPNAQ
jgi:tungstate transport system substrate-binding protein